MLFVMQTLFFISSHFTGSVFRLKKSFTGSFVLAWKRGIAILTAGQVKVTP